MLAGENIICLGGEWSEGPIASEGQQVVRWLARRNHVLWLDFAGERGRAGALRRGVRQLRDLARGPVQLADTLWVYTPAMIPMPPPEHKLAFNRRLLQSTLALVRRRLGMASYHLWTLLPNALPYLGMPGERLVVYYCEDDFPRAARLSQADCERTARLEQETCRRADVVLTPSKFLWDRRRAFNPETYFVGRDTNGLATGMEEIERRVRAVARWRSGKTQERPAVAGAPPRPIFATVLPGQRGSRLA